MTNFNFAKGVFCAQPSLKRIDGHYGPYRNCQLTAASLKADNAEALNPLHSRGLCA